MNSPGFFSLAAEKRLKENLWVCQGLGGCLCFSPSSSWVETMSEHRRRWGGEKSKSCGWWGPLLSACFCQRFVVPHGCICNASMCQHTFCISGNTESGSRGGLWQNLSVYSEKALKWSHLYEKYARVPSFFACFQMFFLICRCDAASQEAWATT